MTATPSPAPQRVDPDSLPPTQGLILAVLTARERMGETYWTFNAKLRPAMKALAELGLVEWKAGSEYRTIWAWLTDAGKVATWSPTYVAPKAEWSVRYRDGRVSGTSFTEAGARQRADELGLEVVWRPAAPWNPAPPSKDERR